MVSMLDWGLGHTSRCIPLLRLLDSKGFKIIVACNSIQNEFLTKEKLNFEWLELQGYDVQYGRYGWLTTMKLVLQIPKILMRIKQENNLLKGWIQEYQPRFILSDNRYGFSSEEVPTYFITHQLHLNTGLGGLVNRVVSYLLYRKLNKNYLLLIPDLSSKPGFAGKLSHPKNNPDPPLHYMGPLSRFAGNQSRKTPNGSILILLSGPEPMRSILEKKLRKQSKELDSRVILVRGLPMDTSPEKTIGNLTIFNHLNTEHLLHYLNSASVVISRSGYSSLMDYATLDIHPILIPTPGQGEQIYLGSHFAVQKWALTYTQKSFSLTEALQEFAKAEFRPYPSFNPTEGVVFDRFSNHSS